MADKQATSRTFNIVMSYADDDTRTIKIPDPTNISSSESETAKTRATALGNLTLSDRSNGDTLTGGFVTVVSGSIVEQTKTTLDLSGN